MNNRLAITLVLLLCAIVIGISGVAVLLGEQQVSDIEATIGQSRLMHSGTESFCDPVIDPGCRPPG